MRNQDPCAPLGDYMHGNIIEVFFSHSGLGKGAQAPKLSGGTDAIQGEVTFEIIRALSSFTDSVVCLVRQRSTRDCQNNSLKDYGHAASEEIYLLKLYDRRHCNRLRGHRDAGVRAWDEHREQKYQRYLNQAERLPTDWHRLRKKYIKREWRLEDARLLAMGRRWTELDVNERRALITEAEAQELLDEFTAPSEAVMADLVNKMFASEQAVYQNLHTLFDDPPIPRYIGDVTYHSPVGTIEGLLLEYIPNSITLQHYIEAVAGCGYSADAVSRLCRQVAAFTRRFSLNVPLLHKEPGPHNILVQLDKSFSPDILWSTDRTVEGTTQERSAVLHGTAAVRFYIIDFTNSRFRRSGETLYEWEAAKDAVREKNWVEMEMSCGIGRALYLGCKLHGDTCVSDHDDHLTWRIWDGRSPALWGNFLPSDHDWTLWISDRGTSDSDSEDDDDTVSSWQESESEGNSAGEEADQEDNHQEEGSEDDQGSEDCGKTAWYRQPKLLVWASPRIPLQSKTRMARPAEVDE